MNKRIELMIRKAKKMNKKKNKKKVKRTSKKRTNQKVNLIIGLFKAILIKMKKNSLSNRIHSNKNNK